MEGCGERWRGECGSGWGCLFDFEIGFAGNIEYSQSGVGQCLPVEVGCLDETETFWL